MFPRRKRLPRAAFPAALATGRRLSSAHFTLVIPSEMNGYAVVLSKKTARLAAVRNRIKRRVLSALYKLPLPRSLIVFPKAAVDSVSYQDVERELAELLSKNR